MPSVVIKCINLTERERSVEFMRNDEVHFEAANSLTAGESFSHDSFRMGDRQIYGTVRVNVSLGNSVL